MPIMTKANSTSKAGTKPIERKKIKVEADLSNVKPVDTHDTTNIKHLLLFLFSFVVATQKSLRDGKFKIHEVLNYRDTIKLAFPAVKAVPQIKNEIKDLNKEEINELVVFIANKFELDNKEIEKKIENIIQFASEFLVLVV